MYMSDKCKFEMKNKDEWWIIILNSDVCFTFNVKCLLYAINNIFSHEIQYKPGPYSIMMSWVLQR